MAEQGGARGWSGQLAAGCVIAVLSWALGAGSGMVSSLQKMEVTLTEVCKQMEEKKGLDAQQTRDIHAQQQHNAVQDRDIDQLFNHLRLQRR
jgi:predicted lipid-binding transport protein (Tim44 family)